MTIPKIIFQTWKSKTDIPEDFAHWSQTMRSVNPDYTYRLWDDADNRAFIEKNFPWFLNTYDGFPAEIYRVDAVRYFFLYLYGGIYADMDVEALRSADDILAIDADVIFGRMGGNPNFEHSIPNALMMSRPRAEFWLYVISLLMDPPEALAHNPRPEYTTGPVLLKYAYVMYQGQYREDAIQNRIANVRARLTTGQDSQVTQSVIHTLAPSVMYPLDWSDRVHDRFVRQPVLKGNLLTPDEAREMFPESFFVTYWSHSWEPQNNG